MLGAQPVNSFSRKLMLVDVAPDDEYRLSGLKARQRPLLRGDHRYPLWREDIRGEWPPWCGAYRDIGIRLKPYDGVLSPRPRSPMRCSGLNIQGLNQFGLALGPARRYTTRLPRCLPRCFQILR